MNNELLIFLDAFVRFSTYKGRMKMCSVLQSEAENCQGVSCSECIIMTQHIFEYDYPIVIINVSKTVNPGGWSIHES